MTYELKQIQDQVAAVLHAWDRNRDANSSAEVNAAIEHLANVAKVKTFGRVGDVVEYEPFSHFLIDGEISGTDVVIVAFGVQGERDDGSLRLLSRALVKNVEV